MTAHPCKTAVVFTAPAGWGKTRGTEKWRREFGARHVVDDWTPDTQIADDPRDQDPRNAPLRAHTLHMTNAHPDQLAHLRCRVVVMGWGYDLHAKHTRGAK